MGFFKSLLSGKNETAEEQKQKAEQKKFEIFKYDGMRAQRMGRMDYAIKCYTEALAIQDDFETRSYLAQTYIRLGQLDEARHELEIMIKAEPTHTDSYLMLCNVCYMQEDYAAMAKAAQQVIQIEEGNAAAHYLLAKADEGQGNQLMCVAHLTQAIMLKEDYTEARLMRAEALMKMGQFAEAEEDLQAVLTQEADNESAILLRARILQATGNEEEAEKDFLHLIALNPFNEQAYLALGTLYIQQKALDKAITLFDEAIEMNPQFAAAYRERGRVKLLQDDKEGATEDMKKALELHPQEAEAVNGEFHSMPRQTDILGL